MFGLRSFISEFIIKVLRKLPHIQSPLFTERENLLKLLGNKLPECPILNGFKVYSQCDEDGIIEDIFKRVNTTDKYFVELGIGKGLENNTRFLIHKGWSGTWLDCDTKELDKNIPDNNRLKIINSFITRDNILKILNSASVTKDFDFLSVDIDGNDNITASSLHP